jgi:tape measure domain-containing protein
MAQYTINFSSNASDVIRELNSVIGAVAKVEKAGSRVALDIDTSRLSRGIAITFKDIDKQINNMQRKLSRLQIGSGAFRSTQASLGFREGQRERGELIGQSLRLRGQAQSFESGSLVNLNKQLQALQIEASQVRPNSQEWASFQQQIGRIRGELQKADKAADAIQLRENLGAFRPGSLDQLSARLRLLKIEANAIAPSTDRWRAVNAEIQKTERGIQRISKKPLTAGQRAGAAGGAFLYGGGMGGGLGSALGGIAGGLAGGVPGAFAGAAGGQVLDNLIQQAGAVAKLSAEYNKSRMALAGVTSDQEDFNKALSAASSIGQKFLLPLVDSTKQFTKLQASVRGAGYDTETTVKAFNGIASAIIATGGSTEDLNGALLATSQVFSKGKVSAEELRQQIGERLAGAFTIFADSSGVAAKELDKLLQKGEVTLDDFIKFLDELGKRYGSTADLLATAPENAGPRLQVAIQAMQLTYAGFFQKVGAGFQAYATDLVNFTITNQKQFQKIVATVAVMAQDIYNIFSGLIDSLIPPLTSFFKFVFENFARGIDALSSLAEQSKRAAGGPEQRAAAAVEALYPNPIDRALKGGKAYQEALAVELRLEAGAGGGRKSLQDRINEMSKNLFAPFQPSKFGAALSNKPAGSAGADGAEDSKQQKLKKFYEDQSRLLKGTLDLRIKDLEAQRLSGEISEYDFQRQKAILELNFQKKIISEGLSVALKQLADENLSTADKELKASQLRKEAALDLANAEKSSALDIEKARQGLLEIFDPEQNNLELEKQKAMIDAVSNGMRELTPDMQAYFDIREKLAGISATDAALIKAEIDAYRAQREEIYQNARALEFLNEQLNLQNRLQLAGILDPRVELRARLRQEKPGFTLDQIEEIATLQETIAEVERGRDQLRSIASSIGDAFGTAFKGIITGTSSVREALAGMFQSIADSFADMVAKMIAEWLKAQLIKGFMSLFPGFGGAAGGIGSAASNLNQYAPLVPMANGGVLSGGFRAFANGGVVTGPTLGLVGEGRYNEAVIPLPDGKSVPVDLGGAMGNQITSNIVVNVSSDGKTSSSGAGSDSAGLGRKLEGAVKQVIVDELRPGGLLSGRR